MTDKQQAYQNILNYCKGYESTGRETTKDYDLLKQTVEDLMKKAQH